VKKQCERNQISVTNNSSTKIATNLKVFCPSKSDESPYKLGSFDLPPKQTECLNASDECLKTKGFFVKYNVDITVTSDSNPSWNKTRSCTWKE